MQRISFRFPNVTLNGAPTCSHHTKGKYEFRTGKSSGMILLDYEKTPTPCGKTPSYTSSNLQLYQAPTTFPFGRPQGSVLLNAIFYNVNNSEVLMQDGVSYALFAEITALLASDKRPPSDYELSRRIPTEVTNQTE